MFNIKNLLVVFSVKSKMTEIYRKGCEAFMNEKFDDAQKYFTEIISIKKNDANSLLFLSSLYLMNGDEDKFIESYCKALELKADAEYGWLTIGRLFISQKMFNRALGSLANAIQQKNDYSEAWNDLGMIYQNKGLIDKAKRSLIKAVKINIDNADGWYNLSQVCLDQNEMDNAILCMKQASKLGDLESQQNLQRLGGKWESFGENYSDIVLSKFDKLAHEIAITELLADVENSEMEELLTTNDIISNLENQASKNNGKIVSRSQKEHFATTVQLMNKIGADRQGSRTEPIPLSRKVMILDVYKLPNGRIIKAGYESN